MRARRRGAARAGAQAAPSGTLSLKRSAPSRWIHFGSRREYSSGGRERYASKRRGLSSTCEEAGREVGVWDRRGAGGSGEGERASRPAGRAARGGPGARLRDVQHGLGLGLEGDALEAPGDGGAGGGACPGDGGERRGVSSSADRAGWQPRELPRRLGSRVERAGRDSLQKFRREHPRTLLLLVGGSGTTLGQATPALTHQCRSAGSPARPVLPFHRRGHPCSAGS